jgi:hypothetical protein
VPATLNTGYGSLYLESVNQKEIHRKTTECPLPGFLDALPQSSVPRPQAYWQPCSTLTDGYGHGDWNPSHAFSNIGCFVSNSEYSDGNLAIVFNDFLKGSYEYSTFVVLCSRDVGTDLQAWQQSPKWIVGPGPYRCVWPCCIERTVFPDRKTAMTHIKTIHVQHALIMTEEFLWRQTRRLEAEGFRRKIRKVCDSFCSVLSSHIDLHIMDEMGSYHMYAYSQLPANVMKLYLIEQEEEGKVDLPYQHFDPTYSHSLQSPVPRDVQSHIYTLAENKEANGSITNSGRTTFVDTTRCTNPSLQPLNPNLEIGVKTLANRLRNPCLPIIENRSEKSRPIVIEDGPPNISTCREVPEPEPTSLTDIERGMSIFRANSIPFHLVL